jgi:TRAP-type C4-dicarboxylate transport system permease small subunit
MRQAEILVGPATIVRRIVWLLENSLAWLLIVVVALSVANIAARAVFGWSLHWGDEVQVYALVFITFLGASVVTWREEHLRMDAVSRLMPCGIRAVLSVVEHALSICISGFLAWNSLTYVARIGRLGQTSDAAAMPLWVPHSALLAGFFLIAVISTMRLIQSLLTSADDRAIGEAHD